MKILGLISPDDYKVEADNDLGVHIRMTHLHIVAERLTVLTTGHVTHVCQRKILCKEGALERKERDVKIKAIHTFDTWLL